MTSNVVPFENEESRLVGALHLGYILFVCLKQDGVEKEEMRK